MLVAKELQTLGEISENTTKSAREFNKLIEDIAKLSPDEEIDTGLMGTLTIIEQMAYLSSVLVVMTVSLNRSLTNINDNLGRISARV